MAQQSVAKPPKAGRLVSYGAHPSQFFRLWTHDGDSSPSHPTVFFLHGGFWKSQYGIHPPTAACETIAPDLVSRGFVVVECEYRRSADVPWGWPHTNVDVLSAYTATTQLAEVDAARIFVVGHSAGGTLALWLAAQLSSSSLREGCVYLPVHTIALAPVADLEQAVRMKLSDDGDAVVNYMHGTPAEKSEAYRAACPTSRAVDLASKSVTLVIAERDDDIPASIVESLGAAIERSRDAAIGGQLHVMRLHNADHFDLVHASSSAWEQIASRLQQLAFKPAQ